MVSVGQLGSPAVTLRISEAGCIRSEIRDTISITKSYRNVPTLSIPAHVYGPANFTEIFEKSSNEGHLTVEYSLPNTLPMGPPPAEFGCSCSGAT